LLHTTYSLQSIARETVMQPEQQKRILGYFIEEAKEHLQTIEHCLLNLQAAVDDPEMLNEVFRAAHSVKGGAAMLGIYSIQQISHKLEDYFKLIKENPIKVDVQLESLFLKSFDPLQELLEELQTPFGLSDQVADKALAKAEPVFAQLHAHLMMLINGGEAVAPVAAAVPVAVAAPVAPAAAPVAAPTSSRNLVPVFQSQVPALLRQMLQLFKQGDVADHRSQNVRYCQQLGQLGEQFSLPTWVELLKTAEQAMGNRRNTFAILAPVLIREIKAAQELVLAGKVAQVTPSAQMRALVPAPTAPAPQPKTMPDPWETYVAPEGTASTGSAAGNQTQNSISADNNVAGEAVSADFFPQPAAKSDLVAGTPSGLSSMDVQELQNAFTPEFPADQPMSDEDYNGLMSLLEEESFGFDTVDTADADMAELEALLGAESGSTDFSDLDALVAESSATMTDFSDLDDLLAEPALAAASDFSDLDALLGEEPVVAPPPVAPARPKVPTSAKQTQSFMAKPAATRRAVAGGFEQTMKVPVRDLDQLGNLVGELVVSRNGLENGQDRMRQFLDNLLYQVQQLSEAGQQMQELYERSLLESALLAARSSQGSLYNTPVENHPHATGTDFDALEMDKFTGFHTLSQEIIERIVRVREAASDIEFVVDASEQVTRTFRQVTNQVQEGLSRSRMIPFSQIADRLPRAVRDLSLRCNKQAELEVEGKDVLVDKGILERLYDPMTHLVNNAIYHGIENPQARQSFGKNAQGKIKVRAFTQGSQTIISVTDDGGGIDVDRVKLKALEKGMITPEQAELMSRQDAYALLFRSGFSTQDQADELAGRGVGMDVVRASIEEIRGTITTDSTMGKGTTFTIRLPLTLSITKALCCIDNHCRIAFPIDGVEDMIDITPDRIHNGHDGSLKLPWRDQLIPFRRLSDLLPYQRSISRGNIYGGTSQDEELISVVILRSTEELIAVHVDQVLGEQEIVIKQLSGPVVKPVGIAGVTVQGDGRVMPIADVLELVDLCFGRVAVNRAQWDDLPALPVPVAKAEPLVLIVDDSITVRELLSLTFSKVGYRVEQARDGQEAWEKLRSGLPCDLVFCDIEMPRMDGLELLSRIQKDDSLNHLPIAMLTSRGADRHRQMATQLGAKGYFTKPYLEEALLDAAKRMLEGEVLVTASA
jgi:chemotaxis protein histidine kinase CheA/ActR/RegA family two-component response regulator